jgi:hypothetical protein
MIPCKEKSFLHLQKINFSLHSRENLPAVGCGRMQPAIRRTWSARVWRPGNKLRAEACRRL